ncbi:Fe(3+) dicitrate ABC transporter ATP-binding protein FecE [Pokkaliibacter sp. MBI-7]|uniref:Fe(3+) dicitrate ABC transporter ATP-binding protein FecE n=1 Tax=Pokkaliibacter sp. MBI-7 TaxID=3040600 RepID=UPI00244D4246|nr:Fe(3+) dicitrate ABC transporter ATP-binding protein FecE [Pokkaliibacter sp. MBI-7]MDH2431451.1 Fe(3+) dicitrate ABC transporter ATP-binding protein FecE [Pokkaliibacter sp. MBI-7]
MAALSALTPLAVETPPAVSPDASLLTRRLQVGYGNTAIVRGVDVQIPHGRMTALLGPNGCGKSTLLKCMARILPPLAGAVLWQGQSVHGMATRQLARQLALLPQTQPTPEGVTVRELVAYGRSPYSGFWGRLSGRDQHHITTAMAATGVAELAGSKVSELSGGQRQRVWLAMVLAQDTDYLLLDEPTTYMDLSHQVELMQLLRRLNQQGKTVVTVLHDINQAARYCDHLIVMKAGLIVAEGTPELILTRQLLAEVFDLDAEIHRDPIAGSPMCVVR